MTDQRLSLEVPTQLHAFMCSGNARNFHLGVCGMEVPTGDHWVIPQKLKQSADKKIENFCTFDPLILDHCLMVGWLNEFCGA